MTKSKDFDYISMQFHIMSYSSHGPNVTVDVLSHRKNGFQPNVIEALTGTSVLEMAGRQMRPKIILGDLIWSEIRVLILSLEELCLGDQL